MHAGDKSERLWHKLGTRFSVTFSPDGQQLLITNANRTVCILRLKGM